MSKQWVFGYGSLLNLASVQDTVPDVQKLHTCYVKGLQRDFSFWSGTGYVVTNPDVAGIPFYALNVTASDRIEDVVNGVMFEVDDHQFERLAMREHGYRLVQTVAYDFETGEPLQECIVYSAVPHRGEPFNPESAPQLRYLQICLTGATHHGPDFYQQFIQTTYIEGHPLTAIESLQRYLEDWGSLASNGAMNGT